MQSHHRMNLMRRSTILLATVAALVSMAAPSVARPPSTIVTWHDWGPYVGEQLPDQGIASAIAREAFAAAGREVTIRFLPWNRAYREARDGLHLAAFPFAHNDERANDFLFTEPLFTSSIRLFAARSHIERDSTLESMDAPSICLPLGYNTRIAERLFSQTHIMLKRPRAMVNCLKMLRFGRVDLVLVSERVGNFIINQHDDLERKDFFLLSRTFETPVHIMVPRTLPGAESLVEKLDDELTRMKSSGRIEAIFERYDDETGQRTP